MALARSLTQFSKLCNLHDIAEISKKGALKNVCLITSVRTRKHYDPKFKWLRGKKVKPVILPHTDKAKEIQINTLKELKLFPRYWKNRPLTITTAHEVFEPYEPPEGDGKASDISKFGLNKLTNTPKSKVFNMNALRKIRNYEPNFQEATFVQEAHDIYVQAHTVLMKYDPDELSKYVTEKAHTEMRDGLKNNTLHWKFIESLEPPKLVQSRVKEIFIAKNLFAQVTVRFHTKQCLALYDRFGRLIYGSEILAKDVLEYVVFEKHLNNEYGVWRIHAKIIPEWKEKPSSFTRTYRIQDEVEDEEEEEEPFIEEDYLSAETEHKATTEIVKAEAKT